jgi:hypothetical protein
MKQILMTAAQLALGVSLLMLWLDTHALAVTTISSAHLGFLSAGLACTAAAIWLQLVRTAIVIGHPKQRALLRPVLLAHSANILLPSLVGDLYEIAALSKVTGRPTRAILVRLIHRLSTTLSALGCLLAAALCAVNPSAGFALLLISLTIPFGVDALSPRLSRMVRIPNTQPIAPLSPQGWLATGIQIVLAIVQHVLSAAVVFFLGAAIADPVSPLVAAGMLAIADAVTYLPIPLGGVGVHHWGVSSIAALLGTMPVALVAFNHAIIVAVAGVLGIIGLRIPSTSGQNG